MFSILNWLYIQKKPPTWIWNILEQNIYKFCPCNNYGTYQIGAILAQWQNSLIFASFSCYQTESQMPWTTLLLKLSQALLFHFKYNIEGKVMCSTWLLFKPPRVFFGAEMSLKKRKYMIQITMRERTYTQI